MLLFKRFLKRFKRFIVHVFFFYFFIKILLFPSLNKEIHTYIQVAELKVIFDEEFTRITSDPRYQQLRADIIARFEQIKTFVETKYAQVQKVQHRLF